jgi:hypothetical protein
MHRGRRKGLCISSHFEVVLSSQFLYCPSFSRYNELMLSFFLQAFFARDLCFGPTAKLHSIVPGLARVVRCCINVSTDFVLFIYFSSRCACKNQRATKQTCRPKPFFVFKLPLCGNPPFDRKGPANFINSFLFSAAGVRVSSPMCPKYPP